MNKIKSLENSAKIPNIEFSNEFTNTQQIQDENLQQFAKLPQNTEYVENVDFEELEDNQLTETVKLNSQKLIDEQSSNITEPSKNNISYSENLSKIQSDVASQQNDTQQQSLQYIRLPNTDGNQIAFDSYLDKDGIPRYSSDNSVVRDQLEIQKLINNYSKIDPLSQINQQNNPSIISLDEILSNIFNLDRKIEALNQNQNSFKNNFVESNQQDINLNEQIIKNLESSNKYVRVQDIESASILKDIYLDENGIPRFYKDNTIVYEQSKIEELISYYSRQQDDALSIENPNISLQEILNNISNFDKILRQLKFKQENIEQLANEISENAKESLSQTEYIKLNNNENVFDFENITELSDADEQLNNFQQNIQKAQNEQNKIFANSINDLNNNSNSDINNFDKNLNNNSKVDTGSELSNNLNYVSLPSNSTNYETISDSSAESENLFGNSEKITSYSNLQGRIQQNELANKVDSETNQQNNSIDDKEENNLKEPSYVKLSQGQDFVDMQNLGAEQTLNLNDNNNKIDFTNQTVSRDGKIVSNQVSNNQTVNRDEKIVSQAPNNQTVNRDEKIVSNQVSNNETVNRDGKIVSNQVSNNETNGRNKSLFEEDLINDNINSNEIKVQKYNALPSISDAVQDYSQLDISNQNNALNEYVDTVIENNINKSLDGQNNNIIETKYEKLISNDSKIEQDISDINNFISKTKPINNFDDDDVSSESNLGKLNQESYQNKKINLQNLPSSPEANKDLNSIKTDNTVSQSKPASITGATYKENNDDEDDIEITKLKRIKYITLGGTQLFATEIPFEDYNKADIDETKNKVENLSIYNELALARNKFGADLNNLQSSNKANLRVAEKQIESELIKILFDNSNAFEENSNNGVNKITESLLSSDKEQIAEKQTSTIENTIETIREKQIENLRTFEAKQKQQEAAKNTEIIQKQQQIIQNLGVDEFLLRQKIERELKYEFNQMQLEHEKKMKIIYRRMIEQMYFELLNS